MNKTKAHRLLLIVSVATLTFLTTAQPSRAAYVITIQQVGPSVVETGSGSINFTALTLGGTYSDGYAFISPTIGTDFVGATPGRSTTKYYKGFTGPASFGTGGETDATSETGSFVGLTSYLGNLFVPSGYVSGSPLLGTATYANATFSTLGFTPGTYTYTWGSGSTADSLTFTTVVPEPSTWAMIAAGALSLGAVSVRRHKAQAA